MRVLHLSTNDDAGGAARAMFRWHAGLRKIGVESEILCLYGSSGDEKVSRVQPDWEDRSTIEYQVLQRFFIEANRTDFSDTFFSHPLGYASMADHELIRRADVVHVHWTSLFFHWEELRRVKASGKTLVLTPHDLWPVTGGCHYPGACEGYLKECLSCPMLLEDPFELISKSRSLKQRVIAQSVDVILSPSHWMDRMLKGVEALKEVAKVVIPYCIDTAAFSQRPKPQVKEELGFDSRRRLVLFCANSVTEGRKGLEELSAVLKICEGRVELRKMLKEQVEFVVIGKGSEGIEIPTSFRIKGRGFIEETSDLSRYYSGADLMIYLGREDNLPNVILEAMACGMPVLAFDAGGVSDLVISGETGEIIPSGDVAGFAAAMVILLSDPKKLSCLGINGREKVMSRFSESAVGPRLRHFYESFLQLSSKPTPIQPNVDADFENALRAATQWAMVSGFRSLEQESTALKQHLSIRNGNTSSADRRRHGRKSLFGRLGDKLIGFGKRRRK
jgi:glycosyltransferase involved in cell wall biosynthesis